MSCHKGGSTGFETCITRLQMQSCVCITDFVYIQDKYGRPYNDKARQYPCRSSPAGVKSVIKLPACCFGRSAAGRQGSHRAKNKRLTQFSSFTLFKPALGGGSFAGADFARGSCEAPRGLHPPACFCIPKDV